jgi:hypothetical protein
VAFGVYEVHIAQLASIMPVQPLAKLTVTPADLLVYRFRLKDRLLLAL